MEFKSFFGKCQNENTVSDFESYLSYCIFEKGKGLVECTVERYTLMRDLAFDWRNEEAAMTLYEMARVSEWQEGDWEGALK
ncbi:MAG: hypothetical protein LLG06_10095 [Desulfobacteraceae bacterium]|nr:hypothetical protein [Desulfobacteraceae bacterium]